MEDGESTNAALTAGAWNNRICTHDETPPLGSRQTFFAPGPLGMHGRTVVAATNNVETALLVTKKAREKNAKAHIIVRCFMDDFAEILETLRANEVISSAQSAFEGIVPRLTAK